MRERALAAREGPGTHRRQARRAAADAPERRSCPRDSARGPVPGLWRQVSASENRAGLRRVCKRRDMKGRVVEVRRFPVKSILGEMPREVTVGESGVEGDRAQAVVDQETGKVASARMPRRWGRLLAFSARYLDLPEAGAPVEVRFPDGAALRSDAPDFDARLSTAVGRTVRMMAAPEPDAG